MQWRLSNRKRSHMGVICLLTLSLSLGCLTDLSTPDADLNFAHVLTSNDCPAPTACRLQQTTEDGTCAEYNAAQGVSCDDGNPDTHNDACNGEGLCIGSALNCPAPSPCIESYQASSCGCNPVYSHAGAACDDGDATTADDQCDGQGMCTGQPIECPTPSGCIQAYQIMGDSCVPTYKPIGTPCDDGNQATLEDVCSASGACEGTLCEPAPLLFMNDVHEHIGDLILVGGDKPRYTVIESDAGRVAWVKATLSATCDSVDVELSQPSTYSNMCYNHNLPDPCAPVIGKHGGWTHNCSSPINWLLDGIKHTMPQPAVCKMALRECAVIAGNGTELYVEENATLADCVSQCILFEVDNERSCEWANFNVKY